MTENMYYKLAQYRIIESSDGTLRWESHAGMAGLKAGRCFIMGNVLIIGPFEIENPGFLKREFLERQSKLSRWDKTEYYGLSHALYICKTGTSISFDEEKVGSQDAPLHRTRNHATLKKPNCKEFVNRRPYGNEAIADIKMKIGKAGQLLRFWYGKIRGR